MRTKLTLATLVVLASLCWSGWLDNVARAEAQSALQRVLVAFGVARTLDGLISVAQGTEIALQPAGVGVSVSAGEMLDPLNDIVERFSSLALIGSVSLGTQIVVTELLGSVWINLLASLGVLAFVLCVAVPSWHRFQRPVLRLATLLLFLRLVFAVVIFAANWLGNLSLADRQSAAIAELTQTSEELRALQDEDPAAKADPQASDAGLLERMGEFMREQTAQLDLRAQLQRLADRAEDAVSHVVTLTVVFLLQYLLLPIGGFWLALQASRAATLSWFQAPAPERQDPEQP
ncbi:MAG: hypothetical protein AAF515_12830 [Pseudomonadota bacterium]